MNDITEPV